MIERPILFSAEMVRAILARQKTQTRRVVRCSGARDATAWRFADGLWYPCADQLSRGILDPVGPGIRCPYGDPGDRLWVKETWACLGDQLTEEIGKPRVYRADADLVRDDSDDRVGWWLGDTFIECTARPFRWRPSLHMPRWASRITLEIVESRIERVQDITDEDAVAEGTPCRTCGRTIDGRSEADCECFHTTRNARAHFIELWDSINGKRPGCSWADNPWVWVISFRRRVQ